MKNKKFTSVCLMTLLIGVLFSATRVIAGEVGEKEQDIFYIYPDGIMEFKGRIMNKKDVVIYEDGRGGEFAAVKLNVPRHSDFYRANIIVVRNEIDVPVVWEK